MNCSKCWQPIKVGDSANHDCGHKSHLSCMPLDPTDDDFEKCFGCRNQQMTLPIKEIKLFNDHDYVEKPIFDKEYNKEIDKIFEHCDTIESIILGEDFHLQEMLYNGVTIDTFLRYGLDWEDLVKFEDLSKPGERRIKALVALKCIAEDFHNYPDRLPIKEIGITAKNLIEDFGLYFPENQPLSTHYGENKIEWTLEDLRKLGVKNQDLWSAGLKLRRQYENLMPSREQVNQMFPSSSQRQYYDDNSNNNNNNNDNSNNNNDNSNKSYIKMKPLRHGFKK